jgi:hypothetical protein
LRSRLTWDGGGATTTGAGKLNLGTDAISRCGAETGGTMTLVVCVSGTRELARSRAVSLDAGAMTDGFMGSAERILSRATSGAGATRDVLNSGALRVAVCEISGAGAMIFVVKLFWLWLNEDFNSGEGGTTFGAGSAGATSEDRNPSAGGGPGSGLNARRFATDSDRGRFSRGASTTFSAGLSPRTTRIV